MKKERKTGIYMIKNIVNDKVYIGQALDIERRWQDHKYSLEASCKKRSFQTSKKLWKDYQKYGGSNFQFSILELIDTNNKSVNEITDELNRKELLFISNVNNKKLYNSPQAKLFNHSTVKKKILQYTLSGKFITEWDSVLSILLHYNINSEGGLIYSCCNGKSKKAYGFTWRYKESDTIALNIETPFKRVAQYDKTGTLIRTWDSKFEIYRELKLNKNVRSKLSKFLQGCLRNTFSSISAPTRPKMIQKSILGYIWKYIPHGEEPESVIPSVYKSTGVRKFKFSSKALGLKLQNINDKTLTNEFTKSELLELVLYLKGKLSKT